jgi:hypothetical protein
LLTAEEQEQLHQWYAAHDQDELEVLATAPAPRGLADLLSRVQRITAQVIVQAQRIQALRAENARLRQEAELDPRR